MTVRAGHLRFFWGFAVRGEPKVHMWIIEISAKIIHLKH